MTPLRLTSWFRRRMLPVVCASSLLVASAAPIAYAIQKRGELVNEARSRAARVAVVLRAEIEERPALWRYDAPKLAARLAAEGLDRVAALVVHDARGVAVPIQPRTAAGDAIAFERRRSEPRLLWGRADVDLDGQTVASIWVGADQAPLVRGTATLAIVFALLAALLGAVLYLQPTRAIARAERRIHALLGQLAVTLQEEERRRIARDLHDGAGQAITAARLGLLALKRQADLDAAAVDAIAHHLDEALDEVRRSTAALAPPALAELGLVGALERHCEMFADAARFPVRCEIAQDLPRIDPHIETACYRIVQEALTNTARHARATRAWVCLRAGEGTLHLEVGDDGAGFVEPSAAAVETAGDLPRGSWSSGHGLDHIRERVRLLGGTVAVDGRGGVRLVVTLPLERSIEELP